MSLADIDYALIAGYEAVGLGLPTAYENARFSKPANNADWAKVVVVPAGTSVESLGSGGKDQHTGFLQIDFNTDQGKGRAHMTAYAQAIRDYFWHGRGLTHNGQYVVIKDVQRTNLREVDGYMRLTVTVFYEAATLRPEN